MPISLDPTLVLLGVPALWTLNCGLAWVGVVRHNYRAYRARVECAEIERASEDGLLRFAAGEALMAERFRIVIKLGLLGFAWLSAWRTWERVEETGWLWDWRDVVAPLVFLLILLLLTHWSNWDAARRPRREPARGTAARGA